MDYREVPNRSVGICVIQNKKCPGIFTYFSRSYHCLFDAFMQKVCFFFALLIWASTSPCIGRNGIVNPYPLALDTFPLVEYPVPPGDSCGDAPLLCGIFLQGYRSHTDTLPPSTPTTDGLCFTLDNDRWLRLAPCTDSLVLRINAEHCRNQRGLEVALLDGNCGDTLRLVPSVCLSIPDGGSGVVTATNLSPRHPYWLLLDGQQGDVCDFSIEILAGISSETPEPGTCTCNDIEVKGPTEMCFGDSVMFYIDPPACTILQVPDSIDNPQFCYPEGYSCGNPDSLVVHWHIPPYMYFIGDSTGFSVQLGIDSSLVQLDTLIQDSVWISIEYVPRGPVDTTVFCTCAGCPCSFKLIPLPIVLRHTLQKEVRFWICGQDSVVIDSFVYRAPGTYVRFERCTTFIHEILFQRDTLALGQPLVITCRDTCVTYLGQQYCAAGEYWYTDSCAVHWIEVVVDTLVPMLSDVLETCIGGEPLYKVQFTMGGAAGPYTVNGAPITGAAFVSQPITSGDTYAFVVEATSNGCATTLTGMFICDEATPRAYLPNAFSPNGDGVNDQYRAVLVGKSQVLSLEIFNRWGQNIYRGRDLGISWDGKSDGKDCPSDVYVAVLRWQDATGQHVLQSDVTLLR